MLKAKEDLTLSYGAVKGQLSLFPPSANLSFFKLRVMRPPIDTKKQAAFDLTIDNLQVRITAAGVTTPGNPRVAAIHIDGLRGAFVRHPDSPPLPPVTFEHFLLTSAALNVGTIGGDTRTAVPVALKLMRSGADGLKLAELPLSLAQATIEGELARRPFVLKPLAAANGTVSLTHGAKGMWGIKALPLSVLSPLAPRGSPLEWKKPYTLRIDSAFALTDIAAGVPRDAPPAVRAGATPIVSYLNGFAGKGSALRLPLSTSLSQTQIEDIRTNTMNGLLKFFVAELGNQIQNSVSDGVKAQAVEYGKAAAKEGFASFSSWWNSTPALSGDAATAAATAAPAAAPTTTTAAPRASANAVD
jgi:hypothetical protein